MPTVPVYRTFETDTAASAPNFGALAPNRLLSDVSQTAPQIVGQVAQIHRQQEEEDSAPIVAQIAPQMQLDLNNALNQAKTQMQPGGKGFAQDYIDTAHRIVQQYTTGVDNKLAQRTLLAHGEGLIAQFGQQAQNLEAGEATGYQVSQHEQGIQTSANLIASNPDSYLTVKGNTMHLIGISPLPPEVKRKLSEGAVQSFVKAAGDAALQQDPQGFAQILTGGSASSSSTVSPADPNAPRGIRNNNPLNVSKSGNDWQGKVAGDDATYETFGSAQAGIRAGSLNAINQQRLHGASTLRQVITRLTPPSENDTAAYVQGVAKGMNVDPDAPINLSDAKTLTAFAQNVTKMENGGKDPYSDDDYQAAVQSALNGQPVGSSPALPTQSFDGSEPAWLKDSTPQQRMTWLHAAQAQINKQNSQLKSFVSQRMQDDTSALQQGIPVSQPLTDAQIYQAYGDAEGPAKVHEYHSAQLTGEAINRYASMTQDQIAKDVDQSLPSHSVPGFAYDSQMQNARATAAARIIKDRSTDPMGFAEKANLADVQPLNFNDPSQLASGLASRSGVAQMMTQKYGTPYSLLSQDDQSQIKALVNTQSASQKAAMLGQMSKQLSPMDFQSITSVIQPNSPVTAIAGQIMGAGRAAQIGTSGYILWKSPINMSAADIAQTMLEGDALINPTKADKEENGSAKYPMPADSDNQLHGKWSGIVGDAFRGRGDEELQYEQAYKAMYAGLAAKSGALSKSQYDDDIADKAARAVIGNITTWNSHNVIPPFGMDENAFKDSVNAQWEKLKTNVQYGNNINVEGMNLDQVGNGVYAVSNGVAPLVDKSGKPVIIRVDPTATKVAK